MTGPPPAGTISALLQRARPESPALLAPGRSPLTYGDLRLEIARAGRRLNGAGIRRHDRIALVVPNGPELAAAFLTVASVGTCAPLNPAYRTAEFEFYLDDLDPVAIVIAAGLQTDARAAAKLRGIRVIELLSPPDWPAGTFDLDLPDTPSAMAEWAELDDVALVLHTSGTTARPKIVPLTHANLCASAENIRQTLRLGATDRCLNVMPLFHVHGLVGAVLSSLAAGGEVVCAPDFVAPLFFEWLDSMSPSWFTAVPTIHQSIVARAAAHAHIIARRPLRFVRSSSAPLPPTVMADVERVFGAPAIEAYGMTEAAHQMACNPLPPGERKPGSVGPAAGPDIAVVNGQGEELPRGAVGDVVIRGDNVTRGYAGSTPTTESAFVNGWFRTGDQGRMDEDGYLFLTGRTKEIINRGGEKVSPREVDEALLEHAAVAQAVTFAIPHERLGEEVAAAIVLRPSAHVGAVELGEFAAERLADFKVPTRMVFVDAIPKGPTGKMQRMGLAAALGLTSTRPAASATARRAPETDTEAWLVDLFRLIVGVEALGVEDDFFEHGGDSILAMRVTARIVGRMGMSVSLRVMFRFRTVAAVAAHLDTLPRGVPGSSADDLRPGQPLVASFAQERIWFLCAYERDPGSYVTSTAYRLEGHLDIPALARSLNAIVARHEPLRTVFTFTDGRLEPRLLPPRQHCVSTCDLRGVRPDERAARIRQVLRTRVEQPFDLSRDVMIRLLLVQLGETEHVAFLQHHHVATDGWSDGVLWRELGAHYDAYSQQGEAALAPLSIHYRDYAAWQRRSMEEPSVIEQRDFWLRELDGYTAPLLVPTDHPRPARQTFRGARAHHTLPRDLVDAIKSTARDAGCTYFMALLAGFQALLFRYTHQERFCVGVPVAGRLRAEAEDLIGMFVNTLPLRADLSGGPTFLALMARLKRAAFDAYSNQDLPLERLIEALRPARSLSHPPLFQVLFQLRNYAPVSTGLRDLTVTNLRFDPGLAQFDVTLETVERGGETDCQLTYNSDLFDESTAARMLDHYATLLRDGARDPDRPIAELSVLTEDERRMMLVEWNATALPGTTDLPVHARIDAWARRTPQAVAIRSDADTWTYDRLQGRANQVAHFLTRQAWGRGHRVGVCLARGVDMVAALLGVMRSGAAYVPLDPEHPEPWRARVVEDARLRGVIDARLMEEEINGESTDPIETDVTHEDAAYVLYTSGSTGTPKGVQVSHGALANVLESLRREPGLSESDTLLALAPVTFDIAAVELYLPLMVGGQVRVVGRADAADGKRLAAVLEDSGASVMQATPATWRLLVESGWRGARGLRAWCGGEELPRDLANQLLDRGLDLWNFFGPTETTVWSTQSRVHRVEDAVPIGRPLANTQVYVLDAHDQPVPIGIPGELCIGGAGIADGYLNREDLTAERFVTLRLPAVGATRVYRTGDMVRWQPDGQLVFIERLDGQVKLRGHRVELGEVESALRAHPAVLFAAALVREDTPGDKRLVAYLTRSGPTRPSPEELRTFVADRLPAYMVPSAFVVLDALPLTPHGKLDRHALEPPRGTAAASHTPATTPPDSIERALLRVWTEVLGVDSIAVDDDFFGLGGHSLLAVRLVDRIESVFGVALPLASLFESSTVASQAALIRRSERPRPSALPVAIQRGGERPPLFLIARFSSIGFRDLAKALGADQPVYGLEPPGLGDDSTPLSDVEGLAAHYMRQVRQVQPSGPFFLGGYSFGGFAAYEMACQLEQAGQPVALLLLIDTGLHLLPKYLATLPRGTVWASRLRHWSRVARHHSSALIEKPSGERLAYAAGLATAHTRRRRRAKGIVEIDDALPPGIHRVEQAAQAALRAYVPRPYGGRIVFVRSTGGIDGYGPEVGWRALAKRLDVRSIRSEHADILTAPHVDVVAQLIARMMDEVP